jgi:hypothetical protein
VLHENVKLPKRHVTAGKQVDYPFKLIPEVH